MEQEKMKERGGGSIEFPRGPEVVKFIRVSIAVIEKDGKVLIGKRPADKIYPGKWEFSGGKIEGVETPEECLRREIEEELRTSLDEILPYLEWDYTFSDGKSYHLIAFRCTLVGDPRPLVDVELKYVDPEELDQYDILESNKILIGALKNAKKAT